MLAYHSRRHLATDYPGRVSQVSEDGQDSLSVVTLDLDSVLADRATGGAGRFQLTQNGTQVRRNGVDAGDDGDGLALATLLATNVGGLVLWEHDFPGSTARAGALIQRLLASFAGDRAFQGRTVKQA